MAVLHGVAGEWSRGEAEKRWRRQLGLIITVSIFVGMGLGLAWSFWPRMYVVLLLMGVVMVVAFPMLRLLDKPMYEMAKTRIKYLRGAQAEGLVGWMLKELEDEWHVFNGMKLAEDWDIDHVVVGPGGLFCVSTKGWRGLLAPGSDGRLMRNAEARDVLNQAVGQGMALRQRLAALLGEDVPWVQAVLAAPLAQSLEKNLLGRRWAGNGPDARTQARRDSGCTSRGVVEDDAGGLFPAQPLGTWGLGA